MKIERSCASLSTGEMDEGGLGHGDTSNKIVLGSKCHRTIIIYLEMYVTINNE